VLYLSALEVCSGQGAIQIHVLQLSLTNIHVFSFNTLTLKVSNGRDSTSEVVTSLEVIQGHWC